MSIDSIDQVPLLDFTAEELEAGDTGEFITKMNSYMSKLAVWSQSVHDYSVAVQALREQVVIELASNNVLGTAYNSVQDHGTFLETPDPRSSEYHTDIQGYWGYPSNIALFDNNSLYRLFTEYNGTDLSAATEAGRRHYGRSTTAGSGPANNAIADAFAVAMNGDAVNGIPFAIAEITAGTGTSGGDFNGTGMHQWMRTTSATYHTILGQMALCFWYQPVGTDAFVKGNHVGSNAQSYINGVKLDQTSGEGGDQYHRLTAGEIYHLAFWYNTSGPATGHVNASFLYGIPGATHRIACPWLCSGSIQLPQHQGPVRSHGSIGNV